MDAILVALLGWLNLTADMPAVDKLDTYDAPGVTRVADQQGEPQMALFRQHRQFVEYDEIPRLVIDAVISAEDKRFWDHSGVDFAALTRAMAQNVARAGSGERLLGASTITQQLTKRQFTDSSRTVRRKAREALMALRIEEHIPKTHIMELYLNDLYFGRGSYGIKRAAEVYFGKVLDQLNIQEAAFLASLPKAPTTYSDPKQGKRAKARRDWIIDQMVENSQIKAEAAEQAKAQPLEFKDFTRDALLDERVADSYFEDQIRRELLDHFGSDVVFDSALSVVSTIDPELQVRSEQIFRQFIEKYDRSLGWRGPIKTLDLDSETWRTELLNAAVEKSQEPVINGLITKLDRDWAQIVVNDMTHGRISRRSLAWTKPGKNLGHTNQVFNLGDLVPVIPLDPTEQPNSNRIYLLFQAPAINGGMVAMQPTTGHIKAVVGGYDFEASNFNRASQALRQPGSAFKPIVYLAALNSGYSPNSIIADQPISFPSGRRGEVWAPKNYDGRFQGSVSLRSALYRSRNVPAINVTNDVGVRRVKAYAAELGLIDNQPANLSIGLGSGLVTVIDMAGAYATIANGGRKVVPSTLESVHNRHGEEILNTAEQSCSLCLSTSPLTKRQRTWRSSDVKITPRSVAQLQSIMQDVVQRGTAVRIRKFMSVPVAGKTGTTNDNKDAWFVGFWGDLLVGVYIGYDQPKSMGRSATGGQMAAPIFASVFNTALNFEQERIKAAKARKLTDAELANLRQSHPYLAVNQSGRVTPIFAEKSRDAEIMKFLTPNEKTLTSECGETWCAATAGGVEGYILAEQFKRSEKAPSVKAIRDIHFGVQSLDDNSYASIDGLLGLGQGLSLTADIEDGDQKRTSTRRGTTFKQSSSGGFVIKTNR